MYLCDGGRWFFRRREYRELSLNIINGVFASLGMHPGGIKKIPTLPKILPSPLHDVTTVPSPLVLF